MVKAGDTVKYIGTNIPKYTGEMLEVDRVLGNGVILFYPIEDRGTLELEGFADVWKTESLICGFDEIEKTP